MKLFKDRQSAGKLLAKRLWGFKGMKGVIVLGIPRGGVVVANEIARELNLPLNIIVTRKIGHPFQSELAVGAVDADGVITEGLEGVEEIVKSEVEEIKRREETYRKGKKPLKVKDKTIILVDDGIATGATTLAAINYLKRHGAKKIILAVPVASKGSVEKIIRELGPPAGETGEFGEVVVLETPDYFQAVGQFYEEFGEVTDKEVIQYLQ